MKLNFKISPYFLFILLAYGCASHKESSIEVTQNPCDLYSCIQGAVVRGDTTQQELSIVFTGGDYADGGLHIQKVLKNHEVKGSFFFTGDFYRNLEFISIIKSLRDDGHYLGRIPTNIFCIAIGISGIVFL